MDIRKITSDKSCNPAVKSNLGFSNSICLSSSNICWSSPWEWETNFPHKKIWSKQCLEILHSPSILLLSISQACLAERSTNQLSPRKTKISLVWTKWPGMKARGPNGTWGVRGWILSSLLCYVYVSAVKHSMVNLPWLHGLLCQAKSSISSEDVYNQFWTLSWWWKNRLGDNCEKCKGCQSVWCATYSRDAWRAELANLEFWILEDKICQILKPILNSCLLCL